MYDTQREHDVDEALLAQQKEIDKINAMTHEELARRWRYAPNIKKHYKVYIVEEVENGTK